MNTTNLTILIASLLIAGLLAGCDIFEGSEIDPDIQAFVESENLPDVQEPSVVFNDSGSEVKVFRVSFGPACDCPSGCIYSSGSGLKFGDRIGWMEIDSVLVCSSDSLDTSRLDYFEVRPGDSTLFSPEFRERYRAATEDMGPDDYVPIYEVFLQLLAGDEDTPVRTLRGLTDPLFEEYLPTLARTLIENPIVRENEDILQRLANLPDASGYQPVREEARELLGENGEEGGLRR